MATVLLAWELGGGLGHMASLKRLGQALVRRGHRVVAALRDVSQAGTVFDDTGINYLQAPVRLQSSQQRIDPLRSAAHILHNVGYSIAKELSHTVHAWTTLLDVVQPALVVADHAPTALVALRGSGIKVVTVGVGFHCPPDVEPLPPFLPELACEPQRLAADEARVLANINAVLQSRNRPSLARVGQLFHEVDENFLVTFAELDHYPQRSTARYWGPWWENVGGPEAWPPGDGPRVFAYLKHFPNLPSVLGLLQRFGLPAVVVLDRPDPQLVGQFSCSTLRLEDRPVHLDQAAQECDFAILNAGHGATSGLLLAGKPVVAIPLLVEQAMVAHAVERSGAGILAAPQNMQQIVTALERIASREQYAVKARELAGKYPGYDPGRSVESVADRVEQLLGA